MSMLDHLRRRRVPSNASFKITQEGRDKLQEFAGDAKSRVLVALETNGSQSIDDLAGSSGLSRGKIEQIIPTLIRGGYVSYMSGQAAED